MTSRRLTAETAQALMETPQHYLTDLQLLELLLDTNPAKAASIIKQGPLHMMKGETVPEIQASYPVTGRQARILAAAAIMSDRFNRDAGDIPTQIGCPDDVRALMRKRLQGLLQEELHVIVLNTHNRIVEIRQIYRGTVNSNAVRPAEVLRSAVMLNAPSIIVVHNHPSGDPTPSPEDKRVTKEIKDAGRLMDIILLDHVVVGGEQCVSIKELEGSRWQ